MTEQLPVSLSGGVRLVLLNERNYFLASIFLVIIIPTRTHPENLILEIQKYDVFCTATTVQHQC